MRALSRGEVAPVSKTILCACEDVTAAEGAPAVDAGHRDLESIKRFTGFGTGMCQGKQCLSAVARFVAAKAPGQRLDAFTVRPPLFPTSVATWASFPRRCSRCS